MSNQASLIQISDVSELLAHAALGDTRQQAEADDQAAWQALPLGLQIEHRAMSSYLRNRNLAPSQNGKLPRFTSAVQAFQESFLTYAATAKWLVFDAAGVPLQKPGPSGFVDQHLATKWVETTLAHLHPQFTQLASARSFKNKLRGTKWTEFEKVQLKDYVAQNGVLAATKFYGVSRQRLLIILGQIKPAPDKNAADLSAKSVINQWG